MDEINIQNNWTVTMENFNCLKISVFVLVVTAQQYHHR